MIYRKAKRILAAASGAILAAPVKLPPKVVAVAKYMALAIGILDTVEQDREGTGKTDGDEGKSPG